MPLIARMSEDVFSRIAAGEVVERPASILKELIENSLDAGASRIHVEAELAGKKLLRVSDNGCGMDAEDLELCLERHATSKIRALEDLENLSTFGFRGEALAAVAAVSRISIVSALNGVQEGWRVLAEAGKIIKSAPAPAISGTSVLIENVFFNVPARLKFLKSDEFERGKLLSVIEEAALSHPETAFFFKSEGKDRLALEALGSSEKAQKDRVIAVLGEALAQNLISTQGDEEGLRLRVFMSLPPSLMSSRRFQYWFINKRPIDSRILQQALYRAYSPSRLQGRHPLCVAYLDLDPQTFDVNVHPAKREIRFRDERKIFDFLTRRLSQSLAESHVPVPLTGHASPFSFGEKLTSPPAMAPELVSDFSRNDAHLTAENLSLPFAASAESAVYKTEGRPAWLTPPYRYLGQIERSYLVFDAAGGLFILDQHAASECVLFERYRESLFKGRVSSERLILPICVSLTASAAARVLDHKDRLWDLGFEIEAFGKSQVQVLSTPPLLQKEKDVQAALEKLAEDISESSQSLDDVRRKALSTIACKAAVKAHDPLSEREAFALLEDLSRAQEAQNCPHGRPTMIALNRSELARRFGRPGAPPMKDY